MAAKNKNKNKMRTTKDGSPIITMDVVANTSGGTVQRTKREKAAVTARNGTTYLIPVDKYGRVPQDALYEHFLDVGRWSRDGGRRNIRADLCTTAEKLHAPEDPRGWRPEELVKTGWWGAVNESDIVGVDDGTSGAFPTFDSIKPSMRAPFGKIALVLPEDRQKFVVETLQNNFTVSELKRMTANHGLVIMEANPGARADGCYFGRQTGIDTPTIYIRNSSGEDTVTHEMIHHARASDPRRTDISKTPEKYDADGYLIPESCVYTNLEEAATVAESTLRTRQPTANVGYYSKLKGDPRELYNADRKLLTNGTPLRGKRAVDRVNAKFEDTAISQLKFTSGPRAAEAVEQFRAKGQYKPRPKASGQSSAKKAAPKSNGSKNAATAKKNSSASSKKSTTNGRKTSSNARASKAKSGGKKR